MPMAPIFEPHMCDQLGLPWKALRPDTVMMRPQPLEIMPGTTARVQKKGPSKLTAAAARHSSVLISVRGLDARKPALLIRMSMRPRRSSASATI